MIFKNLSANLFFSVSSLYLLSSVAHAHLFTTNKVYFLSAEERPMCAS